MKGTIEQIWQNESRSGQPYVTVQIEGERYTVWDEQYFDQLQQGAEIDYDFRQNGNFRNITEIHGPNGDAGNSHDSGSGDGQPAYGSKRDKHITRLSCLKSAAEIIAPAQFDHETKRDLVMDTARAFEQYVHGDDLGTLPGEPGAEPDAGNG